MRKSEDGGFLHPVQVVQTVFDFFRVNIESAADDEVFTATNNGKVALQIAACQISGDEESVLTEFLQSLLREFPIAFENIGAFDFQGADFPILKLSPFFVTNS